MSEQKVYIVAPIYPNISPAKGQKLKFHFKIHDIEYGIYEVELEWGQPRIAIPIEEQSEFYSYYYYDTFEEAFEYAQTIINLNR